LDKIIPAFELSLLDPTISDVCADMLETGIDSLLDDGIFKSIPIVGVLIGAGKTAQNIHERNLLRQTINFINSFNDGTIKREKLDKYRRKISEDSHKAEEEMGRVIILLNKNVDIKKSEILGSFFKEYVNENISWDQFCELSDVTMRLFLADIDLLLKINRKTITDTSQCVAYQAERLNSLGLIETAIKSLTFSSGRNESPKELYISDLGRRFVRYGIS